VVVFLTTIAAMLALFYHTTGRFLRHLNDQQEEFSRVIGEAQENSDRSLEEIALLRDQLGVVDATDRCIDNLARLCRRMDLAVSYISHDPYERVRDNLRSYIEDLSLIYTAMTGTYCRACIKIVYLETFSPDLQQPAAHTLCRDRDHPETDYSGINWLHLNTDFDSIMSSNGREAWFCNDVLLLQDYLNTSINYSYRSVIVWPMHAWRRPTTDLGASDLIDRKVIGFVCIDSDKEGVFRIERDVGLGWWFTASASRLYEASVLASDPDH